jgi:hypothetical protein
MRTHDRRTDGQTDTTKLIFRPAPTTLCFVSRTFIVLRILHSHYRKQNLGSGLIILGNGISTVHQGCQALLVVSLGVVLCHDCLEVAHVRETLYSTAKFMTYAKPRDSVVHDLWVPVMMNQFELSRNNNFFVLWRSLYCLCVYVYWTTAIGWLPNCS